MRRTPNLIYFGEGIGQRGGSFAHTKGMWEEFGGDRMIDTPICELGFTGAAFGAAARGCRAVSDLMFSDFMFEAASQIIQQAAKLRYMSNGQFSVPLLIRAPMGVIKSAGPHHSGAYYPMWAHCPGLMVAVPSNAADAKGLFTAALRTDDPVIIMEPQGIAGQRRRRAHRRMGGPLRSSRHRAPGKRSDTGDLRVAGATLPGGGRPIGIPGDPLRGDRPANHRSPGRGHPYPQLGQDPSPAGRGRGLLHVRTGRRDCGYGDGARLRPAGCPGGPHAYRAGGPSLQPAPGSGHLPDRGPDPPRRRVRPGRSRTRAQASGTQRGRFAGARPTCAKPRLQPAPPAPAPPAPAPGTPPGA